MWHDATIMPTAQRDLERMSPEVARRILRKIEAMRNNLASDVKRLVDFQPPYRLRAGDWRVLFDIVGQTIRIQRIRHHSDAY